MIVGTVTDDGVPAVELELAGKMWAAIIDTGFNGDLELPEQLFPMLPLEYLGRTLSTLAGGQQIEEDEYLVNVSFDGRTVSAEATFAPGDTILVGTNLLRDHRLEVVFPEATVLIERAD